MHLFRDRSRLFCFSPEVMLATFLIETALAVYVFWRYKLTLVVRLVIGTLLALATFQLAEHIICVGPAEYSLFFAHIGFISITLLPALGIHLVAAQAGRKNALVPGGYAAAALVIAGLFILSPIETAICGGNYVIFTLIPGFQGIFTLYYLSFLALGIIEDLWYERLLRKAGKPEKVKLLLWMLLGYLSFLVPTGVVAVIYERSQEAGTSIMCGFAIMLALILVFRVLPGAAKKKSR